MAAVRAVFSGEDEAERRCARIPGEIATAGKWRDAEFDRCGRAGAADWQSCYSAFRHFHKLTEVIGAKFSVRRATGILGDVIPLPHPSALRLGTGMEPGLTLLARALDLLVKHPAWRADG